MDVDLNKKNAKKEVLEALRSVKFPKCVSRMNISSKPTEGFVLGLVNYRNEKKKGPSKWNKKFPHLYSILKEFIQLYYPDFSYTTIQVNKTTECNPHIDKNNSGLSLIIALGDFSGGELSIEGVPYNIRNRWKKFDGTKAHWVEKFAGERYSIVYFTHTFKPPSTCLHGITVTKKGIKNKDGMYIKMYKPVN